jgi:acyl carrier protein
MNAQSILQEYITQEIMKTRNAHIDPNDDLLANGVLDSLAILQVVAFVEDRFNIQIPDEDVVYENFHSVAALSAYLDALKAASTSA